MIRRRLLTAIPLLLCVTFAVFALMDLMSGDPARRIAGEMASDAQVERIRTELGLDRPLPVRYFSWLFDAVQGDFGNSIAGGRDRPVSELLQTRFGVTISLIAVTSVIVIVVGMAFGMISALFYGKLIDRVLSMVLSLAIATPNFFVGILLIVAFSVNRGWLPAFGYASPGEGLWEWLRHLIMPAVALSMTAVAELSRQLKASLRSALESDYVITAAVNGLSRPRIVLRHALKTAMTPVVTVFGNRFAQMIGGTVVVERVFNLPGLGSLAIESVLASDILVLLAIVVLSTLAVVIVNLAVDSSYLYFDPRVRGA